MRTVPCLPLDTRTCAARFCVLVLHRLPPLTCATTRAALFEFYQRLSGVPTFETERHGGTPDLPFLCTLTCPAVATPKGSYEECKFRAAGRSKKAAEHAASEKALEFIRSKGLLPEHVVDAAPPSAAALGDEVRGAVMRAWRPLGCCCAALLRDAIISRVIACHGAGLPHGPC